MSKMPLLTLEDILTATNGNIVAPVSIQQSAPIRGVSTDSRTIEAGMLYVALQGEKFDGHNFAAETITKGACYVLASRACEGVASDRLILVKDTLTALQDLARYRRERASTLVIGVTGSAGKTSAKEMLLMALSSQKTTYATKGNLNNHIGVPLTILNTPEDAEILVLEMGMNHAGEIALLSAIGQPDAALITTVDAAHLEFFDSIADIAHAKAEITVGMKTGSPIALPFDNPYYDILDATARSHQLRVVRFGKQPKADYHLRNCQLSTERTEAEIMAYDILLHLQLGAIGEHHAVNALGVLGVCDAIGMDLAKCASALRRFREPKGRGTLEQVPVPQGMITLIDESYNASPIAMRAAFARLAAIGGDRRTIAILGDMRELGEDAPALHAGLAESIREHQISQVYTTGEQMRHLANALPASQLAGHFESNQHLAQRLIQDIRDQDIILFKASRGSKIEEVITLLKENFMTHHAKAI